MQSEQAKSMSITVKYNTTTQSMVGIIVKQNIIHTFIAL